MKNNVKIAIKISNLKNSKEVQEILFEEGHYWFNNSKKYKKYKDIPMSKYEPLYITTNHYKNDKDLTFARFKPINHLYMTDSQLIRKYKLKKLKKLKTKQKKVNINL